MRIRFLHPTAVYLRTGCLVALSCCAGASSDSQARDATQGRGAAAQNELPKEAASTPTVDGVPDTREPAARRLASPRRSLGFELRLLWKTDTASVAEAFVHPFDIHFSDRGLLVMDIGDSRVKTLDSRTGSTLARAGGEGSGLTSYAASSRCSAPGLGPCCWNSRAAESPSSESATRR